MYIRFLISMLPIIAAFSGLVYLVVWLIDKRNGKKPIVRHIFRYIFVGYCVSLVYFTILWYYPDITFNPEYHLLNLHPFIWLSETYDMGVEKMVAQLAYNVGMFVPYGFLLPVIFIRMRSFLKASGIALATTLFIETLQYFMGRSCDIDDVLTNLAGGMIGYLIFMLVQKLLHENHVWKKVIGAEAPQSK